MKRLRPVNSCLPCRKRCVRCDKVSTVLRHPRFIKLTLRLKTHPVCKRCAQQLTSCIYDSSATLDNGRPSISSMPPTAISSAEPSGSVLVGNSDAGMPAVVNDDQGQKSGPLGWVKLTAPVWPHTRSRPSDSGHVYRQPGQRSRYFAASFWANAIPSEVSLVIRMTGRVH